MCQFSASYTIFIRIPILSRYRPPCSLGLARHFVHTRVRDTTFGLDSLETFSRKRQAFMGALHVACQFVLPGKAVLPTEWAADNMAWETFGILAMNGRVVSFHVVFALGADSTAVIFAGIDPLPVLITSLLTEMTYFVGHRTPDLSCNKVLKDFVIPSTAFNTAGYFL